jgi:hypothetical protein
LSARDRLRAAWAYPADEQPLWQVAIMGALTGALIVLLVVAIALIVYR